MGDALALYWHLRVWPNMHMDGLRSNKLTNVIYLDSFPRKQTKYPKWTLTFLIN